MNSQLFIANLKSPQSIDNNQLQGIELLVNEYPYFQSAHLLFAKGLHNQQALNYNKQLRKTAIVANSRSILYQLIHQKNTLETIFNSAKIEVDDATTVKQKTVEVAQNISPAAVLSNDTNTLLSADIKVIYVNTISTNVEKNERVEESKPEISIAIHSNSSQEIELLKDIENNTEAPTESFNEGKLNSQLEKEIERGIIQSYVETEIIKTPTLNIEEQKEPVSFTDWLHKVKKESASIQKTEQKTEPKITVNTTEKLENVAKTEKKDTFFSQNKNIIDKIIESDPGRIKLGATKFFTPNIDAKQSLLENEHLVTETLAKIYALQGNNSKAIRAYEILSLKFPQKSVYFATLIEKLKTKN